MGRKKDYMTSLSRFISLILRHKPYEIGIAVDEHGWADAEELMEGINKTSRYHIDREILEQIVAQDEKQRYSFSDDGRLIRANQGHSIPVDVELSKEEPPEILYHGTGEKSVSAIEAEGLKPMSRLYVHLSKDMEIALKVGRRHGKPVIFKVLAGRMSEDGFAFYVSANGVWLTKAVPVQYLEKTV